MWHVINKLLIMDNGKWQIIIAQVNFCEYVHFWHLSLVIVDQS
jgi:hypothetical protein